MYTTCSELGFSMYWTHNSMNNLLSYYGLVDSKIRASVKDLPVHRPLDFLIVCKQWPHCAKYLSVWKGWWGVPAWSGEHLCGHWAICSRQWLWHEGVLHRKWTVKCLWRLSRLKMSNGEMWFEFSQHSVLEQIWIKCSYLSQWLPQGERRPPKESKSRWIEILHVGSH